MLNTKLNNIEIGTATIAHTDRSQDGRSNIVIDTNDTHKKR